MPLKTRHTIHVTCPECGEVVPVTVSLDHVVLERGLWLLSQVRVVTTEHTCPEDVSE